jgi:hypothetical protein
MSTARFCRRAAAILVDWLFQAKCKIEALKTGTKSNTLAPPMIRDVDAANLVH